MLLGNILKVLNCAVRAVGPSSASLSIRQLSTAAGCANELKEVNLNQSLALLGRDVEFYRLSRVSKEAVNDYKSTNLAFIADQYAFGKYSVPVLYKGMFKRIERELPIVNVFKRKWRNRPKTEFEAMLGRTLSGFMPYIDVTMITIFPKWMQASYFVFFRPAAVYSGLGAASTIKMLNDRMISVGPESNGRLYVLVKISREEAIDVPINEIAIKFKKRIEDEDD